MKNNETLFKEVSFDKRKEKMSFYDYLMQNHYYEGGFYMDLVDDIQKDDNFPRKAKNKETIENYLKLKKLNSAGLNMFYDIYRKYELSLFHNFRERNGLNDLNNKE